MINWHSIDTVLLDMDGTLLDLHYDNHFWLTHLPQRYADLKRVDLERAGRQLRNHINAIEGTLNWYCLDYWSQSLGLNIPELKKETKHKIKERPYAREFLSELKNSNKRVYLVTNSHPAGIEIKLEHTRIGEFFDGIVSSHQYRQPKEDIGFWQQLHEQIHFDTERTLFIDDNLSVLNTAMDFGIQYILGIHQPDSQIVRKLTEVPAIYHFDEILPGLNNG